jgi:hypothetical protein
MKKFSLTVVAALTIFAAGGTAASAQPYDYGCHERNAAAGTVLGAVAGGLLGGALGHGNGGAVIGGLVLGGVAGNAIARDMDCGDRPYAFRVYQEGLNGPLHRRYHWENPRTRTHGWFMPVNEYYDRGWRCRDFTVVTFHHRDRFRHNGQACSYRGGRWEFR